MRSSLFLDNLNDSVRKNPVAASLIGLGVAWMVFRNSNAVVRQTAGTVRAAKDTIDKTTDVTGSTIGAAVTDGAQHLRETAAGMSDAASQTAKAVASKVADLAGATSRMSGDESDGSAAPREHAMSSLRQKFEEMLDRQPLALAVLGVAAGTALASAFPTTEVEDRVVGSTGAQIKDHLQDATDVVVDRMGKALEGAVDEAVAQGLTPEAIEEAAKAGAKKMRAVGEAARQAVEK
jgi:hypothetical protein